MLQVDWSKNVPMKPKMLGTKTYTDYPLAELLPYIDWNPFFQVWQLRGKYPNRGYPKIFNDESVGEEAKKLHTDALKLIDEIIANLAEQLQVRFSPPSSLAPFSAGVTDSAPG